MRRTGPAAYIFSSSPLIRELLAEVLRARLGVHCGAGESMAGWHPSSAAQLLLVDANLADNARDESLLQAARLAGVAVVPFDAATPVEEIVGAVRRAMRIAPTSLEALTPHETQVLIGLAAGQRNAEIARRQRRSVKTVEKHRANVHRKLGMKTVAQLTAYAVRAGLLDLDAILSQRKFLI